MAASTTIAPRSSNSSGSSTPWLSPEPSSSAWRHSYSNSADLSRRTSSASTSIRTSIPGSESSTSRDPHAHEWWEHVLPPGQLAERLRKAQRSSSASRRRNNPALANATPSERSAWKRLSGLPREDGHHDRSGSSTATSSRRSSFQGTASTLPRSALRTAHRHAETTGFGHSQTSQPVSSAEVSSDEYTASPTGRHSPLNHVHFAFPSGMPSSSHHGSTRMAGVQTTSNSPELVSSQWTAASSTSPPHTGTSSSFGRRMRVMSEDGIASSPFAGSHGSYRLPSSQSAIHLSHYAVTSEANRTWTTSAADRARPSSVHNSLPDTPELSSDETCDGIDFTASTTTTQRTRRISTTRTTLRSTSRLASPPTILRSDFDRPDQPSCSVGQGDAGDTHTAARPERHVSFDAAPAVPRRASVHDYTEPLASSQSAFSFGSMSGREYVSPFDTLPPRSNSTRRARQGVRVSGRRSTSFSLPGSRRNSMREDAPFEFGAAGMFAAGASHRRTTSVPDAALLDSLNVAHKQLASAGNLAMTLTRQLSAPLRPVFQMTLFLSISSITVLSLACFLCASYMLTAWDDVGKRSQKVGEVAGRTRHQVGRTLTWGMRMLGAPQMDAAAAEAPGGDGDGRNEARAKKAEDAPRGAAAAAGRAMLWPARLAWSSASTVAYRMTPAAVSSMFAHRAPGKAKTRTGSTLPPRPPLSTLLPSILFTLMLALGAGLTSFLASRKAAAEAARAGAGGAAHPYSVPERGSGPEVQYVHMPAASPFAAPHGVRARPRHGYVTPERVPQSAAVH